MPPTHVYLLATVIAYLDSASSPPPIVWGGGNSANYSWMRWAAELARAFRPGGTASEQNKAVKVLLAMYARERTFGLGTLGTRKCEQMVCSPHDNLHDTPHALIRRVAIAEKLEDLLSVNGWWWQAKIAIYRAHSSPDGRRVVFPGTRFKADPTRPKKGMGPWFPWEQASALFCEVTSQPQSEAAEHALRARADDWRGVAEVRRLLRSGDDLGSAGKVFGMPKLALPVRVRNEGGLLTSVMVNPYGKMKLLTPVYSVQADWSSNEVTWSREEGS